MLPIKLYKEVDKKVEEVQDDRVSLLNDDTKDSLDGYQFKKALIEDYLLNGAGYAYINRNRNKIKSLHYVKNSNVHITENADVIFKKHDILVQGKPYRPFEFIKVTRKTINGVKGIGILSEHNGILAVCYNSLIYENIIAKTGGNKKGFLKSASKLSQDAIDALKTAWANLYSNNGENVVVLNNGLEFQEASNTSVEMQMNENKNTNSIEICKLVTVPPSMLDGTANEEDNINFFKQCILPILKAFETALNKDLLLESEKGSFYFAFDTKEMLKADIEKRYKAYEIAVKNGILQVDEVRYIEDLEPLGLDFIKLGLQDVLYSPKTKEIYTPNTDKKSTMNPIKKSGDDIEN
jgi:HK97 family phage portal protein